jgi:hypothetical protein
MTEEQGRRLAEWTCFHCGETFTDEKCAGEHFGGDLLSLAACQIKAEEGGLVALIRKQEAELDRHRSEDTASYREFYSLGADHTRALMRAEEAGYEKGLADGRSEAATAPQGDAGEVARKIVNSCSTWGGLTNNAELIEAIAAALHQREQAARAEERRKCATAAAIHSCYPIETDWERGYDTGRKDAAAAIRNPGQVEK